jgi:hypothetical protein
MKLTLILSLFAYIFGVSITYLLRKRVNSVNLNNFAKEITIKEGLKKSVSIAQVKEIVKLVLTELARMTESELTTVLNKYRKKKR